MAVPVTEDERGGLPHAVAAVADPRDPHPRDPRGVRYPLTALLTVPAQFTALGSSYRRRAGR